MYFILYRYLKEENWCILSIQSAAHPTIQKFETAGDAKETAESIFREGCTYLIVREVALIVASGPKTVTKRQTHPRRKRNVNTRKNKHPGVKGYLHSFRR